MNELTDEELHQDWSRDTQKTAVLTWISFLTAAAFTMLFFAFIDPLVIVDAINVGIREARPAQDRVGKIGIPKVRVVQARAAEIGLLEIRIA